MPASVSNPASESHDATYSQALHDIEEVLRAIPESQVLPIRLDIPTAAVTVLGAAPEARRYKPQVVAIFGESDAAAIDRLEQAAHAAAAAHGAHLALTSDVDLEPLVAAVIDHRTRLLLDVQSLVARKLVDPSRLANLRGGQAYKDRITDVILLVAIFKSLGDSMARVTKVTMADLEAAEAAASTLGTAMGVRVQGATGSTHAQLRERAYTHMVRTYDFVRRMLTYLRWREGDVDEITPSLWAGRVRQPDNDVPTGTPVGPAPNNIAPGLPGASPFAPNR